MDLDRVVKDQIQNPTVYEIIASNTAAAVPPYNVEMGTFCYGPDGEIQLEEYTYPHLRGALLIAMHYHKT